jgi:hypothetical protein
VQFKVFLKNFKLADFLKMVKFDERDKTSGAAVPRVWRVREEGCGAGDADSRSSCDRSGVV